MKGSEFMKVPKMYKSSDRYNAGTDVIYDDDSKLQYAPFIYATTKGGENDNGGDDEEGEEGMLVTLDANMVSNISYNDVLEAVLNGKVLYSLGQLETASSVFYLTEYGSNMDGDYPYYAIFTLVAYEDEAIVGNNLIINAATDDGNLAYHTSGGGGGDLPIE